MQAALVRGQTSGRLSSAYIAQGLRSHEALVITMAESAQPKERGHKSDAIMPATADTHPNL